jgi:2-polyprenyl-3-methyl-5-hydroxy-6-metoxy-1,4-benzoquinol methylase
MNPSPRLIPLPANFDEVQGVFFRPKDAFIEELAHKLRGARVLEIFAGNGYLAARLSKWGVDITATSILSSMDAHRLGI